MKIVKIIALSSLLIVGQSCNRKITRISPNEVTDISGRWNDTDSKLTAEEITKQALAETPTLRENSGNKLPVVIVGIITNKSHEHIDAETFTTDIERAFIASKQVRLVQGGKKREEIRAERADQQENSSVSTMKKWGLEIGADYMMQGSINSIVDSYKRKKTVYYQINMELVNIQTNEIVWIGEKKIKKMVVN